MRQRRPSQSTEADEIRKQRPSDSAEADESAEAERVAGAMRQRRAIVPRPSESAEADESRGRRSERRPR